MKIIITLSLVTAILLTDYPQWVKDTLDNEPKFMKIDLCYHNDTRIWIVNGCTTCSDMSLKIYDDNHNLLGVQGGVMKQKSEIYAQRKNCETILQPQLSTRSIFDK